VRPTPALEERLATERVAWLTTVRPDGRPHVVPIWFSWDGQAFLVYSKPHARKVENLRERPDVMLALGDADADFDVILVEGRAELIDRPAEPPPGEHFAKYAAAMAAIDLDRDEYTRTYSLVIRVTPTRFLPWSGRTHLDERRSAVVGAGRTARPAPAIT
jgi:PPOX class probable F420-dependent enzyme